MSIVLPDHLGPWAAVANITRSARGGPDPERVYRGTPVFAPGARVTVGFVFWGAGIHACVIGQNRVSKRLVPCVIDLAILENFRAKAIHSPALLKKLLTLEFSEQSKSVSFGRTNDQVGLACLLKSETETLELIDKLKPKVCRESEENET